MIQQLNAKKANGQKSELPTSLTENVTNDSVHGRMAVEFMAAQLIESVKQTHTHQIQVTLTDSYDIWKVSVEKISGKDKSDKKFWAA
jgi:hypothetical protein